ncbi:BRCA1-associated ATM activator 1 isoform X2 [Hippocampus zosterae]|uniref:BRCA1-associated ATM activator 1 isoform X2 n=1 Tax=Hippocampus zosterae TaxID=109293 RepID=UPI00223D9F29|nr:BRCA1-associated ATM activator 1 isoform X2 [Hippocampus zosterae]
MDRESASLLATVCALLADSAKPLPDDTSLEKLLDRLTEFSEAGVSLPDSCPCLLDFISTIASNSTSDPSILSFALKLSGLLAATEDDYRALQERSVLDIIFSVQRWKDAELWDDPCIRIGWIHGLKRMLLHPKALAFFVQSGFITPLLQLQSDPSMFVASAANQLLAHILLAIQSENEEHANIKTNTEHSRVVLQTTDHIKESLVPKESTLAAGSRQVLKLLALILDQARRPLRDQLLTALAASLEKLAEAGYSQMTPALMDVIMAGYSPDSDDVTSHLLSSMLNVNKPTDLVQAAAAFLHQSHSCASSDTANIRRVVRILLLPLHFVTEHPLLGTAPSADTAIMTAQLKNKSMFISMICVCLRNAPQVALMPPGILPCHPAMIVLSVVTLLRICSGDASTSSSSSLDGYKNEVYRCIVSSGKVQKSALEALASLSSSTGADSTMKEVSEILLHYMSNPDSDPTVLQKSYKAFVQWTSVWTDHSFISQQLREDLFMGVEKRACDPRWEVRDSTIEFLGQLHCVPSRKSADSALLSECLTAPLLREALQDPESYVRASAISALARGFVPGGLQGTELSQEQTDTVDRLLKILCEDTEGFARRAVVRYFMTWLSSCSSPPSSPHSLLLESVRVVLSRGSLDLDWEVKVNTLELAELLLDAAFLDHGRCTGAENHPYAPFSTRANGQAWARGAALDSALSSLVDQGVFSVLLSGLVDCDRPVALKACELLIRIRETINGMADVMSGVSCELPEWGWGKEIRKVLKNEGDESRSVSVCQVLTSLALDERRVLLSQSSDHVHNSFQSLLQDILSAGVTLGDAGKDDGQEVIVDCY